jgi:hypothetical protein
MRIINPYLYSSGGMKGEGEARAGVGEGSSVSVPVLSWEAVMRPLEAVVAGVISAQPFHSKKSVRKILQKYAKVKGTVSRDGYFFEGLNI